MHTPFVVIQVFCTKIGHLQVLARCLESTHKVLNNKIACSKVLIIAEAYAI